MASAAEPAPFPRLQPDANRHLTVEDEPPETSFSSVVFAGTSADTDADRLHPAVPRAAVPNAVNTTQYVETSDKRMQPAIATDFHHEDNRTPARPTDGADRAETTSGENAY